MSSNTSEHLEFNPPSEECSQRPKHLPLHKLQLNAEEDVISDFWSNKTEANPKHTVKVQKISHNLQLENDRFVERHIIEHLDVEAADASKQVIFYNLLNQGRKRGK